MNEITRYRREVKRLLFCSPKIRTNLLAELDGILLLIRHDNAECSRADLISSLGTPSDMAYSLLQRVNIEEQEHYRRGRAVHKIIIISVLLFSVLFCIICARVVSETPFRVVDSVIIEESTEAIEIVPTTT